MTPAAALTLVALGALLAWVAHVTRPPPPPGAPA